MNQTHTSFPKHHRVLALDLATKTGWASLEEGILKCGTEHFIRRKGRRTKEDEHEGIVFSRMEIWLWKKLKELEPDMVVFEETAGHFKTVSASRTAFGWRSLMMACCARLSIPTMSVAASTVKKYATGSGRAEKPDMIHAAKQKFVDLDVDDDNAADAVHILCYGMSAKYQLESF
jgi:Holliday junction resolvasome RuvABC endonuclease subunit